jgi:hypothetical protein
MTGHQALGCLFVGVLIFALYELFEGVIGAAGEVLQPLVDGVSNAVETITTSSQPSTLTPAEADAMLGAIP